MNLEVSSASAAPAAATATGAAAVTPNSSSIALAKVVQFATGLPAQCFQCSMPLLFPPNSFNFMFLPFGMLGLLRSLRLSCVFFVVCKLPLTARVTLRNWRLKYRKEHRKKSFAV